MALSGKLSGVVTIKGKISPIGGLNAVLNTPQIIADYNILSNKPKIEGITLEGNLSADDLNLVSKDALVATIAALNIKVSAIYIGTEDSFNDNTVISEKDAVYIYTNHTIDSQGRNVPAYKIGDGNAYVVDLPYSTSLLEEHINDTTIHITDAERTFWNNKVRCFYSTIEDDNLIFTTN